MGLDNPVVVTLKNEYEPFEILSGKRSKHKNTPPGYYVRKIKTQRNWRELNNHGGSCGLI